MNVSNIEKRTDGKIWEYVYYKQGPEAQVDMRLIQELGKYEYTHKILSERNPGEHGITNWKEPWEKDAEMWHTQVNGMTAVLTWSPTEGYVSVIIEIEEK